MDSCTGEAHPLFCWGYMKYYSFICFLPLFIIQKSYVLFTFLFCCVMYNYQKHSCFKFLCFYYFLFLIMQPNLRISSEGIMWSGESSFWYCITWENSDIPSKFFQNFIEIEGHLYIAYPRIETNMQTMFFVALCMTDNMTTERWLPRTFNVQGVIL